MSSIRIHVIRDWPSLAAYSAKWSTLVRSSEDATVFQTFEWNESWWTSFGSDQRLLVLLAEENDRLIAIAPMMISRELRAYLPRRVLRFLGSLNFSSDYCDFIVAPGRSDAVTPLLDWISTHRKLWDRMDCFNLPSHSPRRVLFERRFREMGFGVASSCWIDAPTRILGNPIEDAEALSKKSLKRHFNYFHKNGELTFCHLESRAEILAQIELFFQQHIERRAVTVDDSLFRNSKERNFYRELVNRIPSEWLRFSMVSFNGKPIAFHFGFEFGGRYIWYKPSFAVEWLKKSPGEVLLKFLLEYAIDRKLGEFDFTVGEEAFKYRFSNRVRTNHRIQIFGRAWEYRLFLLLNQLRVWIKPLKDRMRGRLRSRPPGAATEAPAA